MSIESYKKQIEQQKLETSVEKPKTGKEALDDFNAKFEIFKAQREGKEITDKVETSAEKPKTGKEALDDFNAKFEIFKAQREGKEITDKVETSAEKPKTGKEALDDFNAKFEIFKAQREGKDANALETPKQIQPGEVRTTAEGSVIICNEVKPATDRKGYEKILLPPSRVGLVDFQRSHSQGAGLGNEMKEGILYAPKEVNLKLQNHGIERYIRDIRDQLRPDAKLLLTTETKAHEKADKKEPSLLKSIDYKLEVEINGKRTRLFEASIEVDKIELENIKDNKKEDSKKEDSKKEDDKKEVKTPRITVSAQPYTDDLERFLR
ncbi:polymorphic toxin type 4 domain-containing protein [Geminocystis sp. CENA526]|uniref:polymorphic toxin type 4 domain-containing protein n=1 Tax=Geminocystis sp. CENA526 TaxID=1355871 RepID=UPI003D6EC96E